MSEFEYELYENKEIEELRNEIAQKQVKLVAKLDEWQRSVLLKVLYEHLQRIPLDSDFEKCNLGRHTGDIKGLLYRFYYEQTYLGAMIYRTGINHKLECIPVYTFIPGSVPVTVELR